MLDTAALDALRERYTAAIPALEEMVGRVVSELETGIAHRGVAGAVVEGRVKELASFVKKMLVKSYDSPWDDIRDKAGVRVTSVFAADVPEIEAVVTDEFTVLNREDKRQGLAPDQFDYLGIHFDVAVGALEETATSEQICEIQIRTGVETAWANASHDLLYKTPLDPPAEIKRGLHRLLALVELFDLEVARTREAIMAQTGYEEGRLLFGLEQAFLRLTAHRFNPELSRAVISGLAPLLPERNWESYRPLLEGFIGSHQDKLRRIYDDYLSDDRNPLISQPESLLIFERIENDRFRLAENWSDILPASILRSMSEIWGTPVDVED
jgi:ppGpp synthetase/RelA/SpoT-type nucleotidyltranferase